MDKTLDCSRGRWFLFLTLPLTCRATLVSSFDLSVPQSPPLLQWVYYQFTHEAILLCKGWGDLWRASCA